MTTGSFKHALNDGEVEVFFQYKWPYASSAEITKIMFEGVRVSDILHPEDYEYLQDRMYDEAEKHKYEELVCAAEAAWERERDDAMMGELT